MSAHCHSHTAYVYDPKYRKLLWWVLIINAAMFAVEISAGIKASSMSLLADALDFAGDAGNIAISLLVINAATAVRAKSSLFKALCMTAFGLWVMVNTIIHLINGTLPKAEIMGSIGLLALFANLFCVYLLYKFREGDSNVMSVWLCTRNDAIGNVLVIVAGVAVYFTSSNLPDVVVALIMTTMGLMAAYRITKQARAELRHEKHHHEH